MRKIGIFATVAMLLLICVMPASAAEIPAVAPYGSKTMPVVFDFITDAEGWTYPWLFNNAISGTDETRYCNGFGARIRYTDQFVINLERDTASVTLASMTAQIVDKTALAGFVIAPYEERDYAGYTINVKGSYYYTYQEIWDEEAYGTTLLRTEGFNFSITYQSSSRAMIGEEIASHINLAGQSHIYFRELSIEIIPIPLDSNPNPDFSFIITAPGHSNGYSYGADFWWNEQSIEYDYEVSLPDSAATNWVMDVVEGFLDFTIVPGFTFGTLLWIIVVIGLMLLLFKIMS